MKAMKNIFLSLIFVFAAAGVKAQIIQPDTTGNAMSKPQVHIQVQKKYDKNGNLIRYDSTYEWTYRNGNENVHIDMRQMMGDFKPFFRQNLPDSLLQIFGNPNFDLNDSSMMDAFFNNAHFFDQWQREIFDMNREMQAMDSLRMEFLKRYMHHLKHQGKQKNPLKAGVY